MFKKNFAEWFNSLTNNIVDYEYFVDFNKVYQDIEDIKIELNIMNCLIGSKNIENDFEKLFIKYPEIRKCIPILLATRQNEIEIIDNNKKLEYDFKTIDDVETLKKFMNKTGLFDLISNHIINNLVDYVTGVEVGLNSNARKNRIGHLMEDTVEKYIQKAGFIKNQTYFKEMYLQDIERKWKIDLSKLSDLGNITKRFDFVVKTKNCIYAFETNFYSTHGSKLNEITRSYKLLAERSRDISGFNFIWITDGEGWGHCKNNLKDVFYILDNLFNLNDLKQDKLIQVLK